VEPAVAFQKYARALAASAPADAEIMRRCAADSQVLALVPDPATWDVPHRLTAAVEWLVLAGDADDYERAADPWEAFRAAVLQHADFVAAFVRERRVQTNEVQRCFALLPIFLTVARQAQRPLDLIELGCSAGLNLLWDRYRYRYLAGTWGSGEAGLELTGEERSPVPVEILDEAVTIRRRRGIDLNPLDMANDEHVRLLRVFTARHRQPRLLAAVEIARAQPPELIAGDYLEVLPGMLEERDPSALTVVFQTLSTIYLSHEERERLRRIIDEAGAVGPLAWISTPTPEEHGQRRGDYPIELALWPASEGRIVARMENHGEWLEWVG
jgi:hypothetical protein